jgi:phage shock protein PspC (stress-responsive transcriptional regulator)
MQPVADPRFHRGSDRILGGVCSGLAGGFRIDPLWVRIAFVLLAFVQGVGIFLYVVLWLVMPEHVEGQAVSRSGFDSMTADLRRLWSDLGGRPAGQAPAPAAAPTVPEGAPASPRETPVRAGWRDQPVLLGVLLIVIGVIFLGNNAGLFNWDVIWPVALITLGIVLMLRSAQRKL